MVLESFRIAWNALLTHKLRAILTMLGVIIGVGAVVGMLAIGDGYGAYIRNEFVKLGVGVFYVNPRLPSDAGEVQLEPQLLAEDAEAIVRSGAAPSVAFVAYELNRNGVISAGGLRYRFGVKGVSENYFAIGDQRLGGGRYFSDEEARIGARVVIIGDNVARTLYGPDLLGALGQRLTINGVQFEVIGVSTTEQSGASGALGRFSDPADQLYLPYRTARDRLFRNEINPRADVSSLSVQVRDPALMDAAISEVTAILREEHRLSASSINDFSITDPEQVQSQFSAITIGFSAFLGTIGGISLLVGGIGIMNIMLVSVTQRTKEIGLRKAVGARRIDILLQFLIEAVVLCLFGAILGVGLGYLFSLGGSALLFALSNDPSIRATITPTAVSLAGGIAVAVGVIFGLFPAIRASRLDPIRALRND